MLLWIRQALFLDVNSFFSEQLIITVIIVALMIGDELIVPRSAILSNHAIRPTSPHIALCRFSLQYALSVCLSLDLERGIILWLILFKRIVLMIDLTIWKLEIVQLASHQLPGALHANLDTELNAPFAACSFSCLAGSFRNLVLSIYNSHNSQYYRCFCGYGKLFLQ